MDFCAPMLEEAEAKKRRAGGHAGVSFRPGDAMALPLADGAVDAITIAFGLRNLADRRQALREMHRVLRQPQGRLFVLEFSQPRPWFRPAYYFYLQRVLPRLAGLVTGDRTAYDYLCGSIEQFPDRSKLGDEFDAAGFTSVEARPMSLGIVALHEAAV
jgi:demethylmenaquinone methyltransferase/2-methoxy-6-polyprenyl-1,4-benzoquinol methylase